MATQTSLEERIQIAELSAMGLSDSDIAKRTGWSLSTVRKWRRRYQKQGRFGLKSPMGRPKKGSMSSFPPIFPEEIAQMRQDHPGWGPKTIHTELKLNPMFGEQVLPSPATIGRYLKEVELSKTYQKHQSLPDNQEDVTDEAHEVWQMDAKGYEHIDDVGMITLINLNDRHTHLRLLSYPCQLGQQRCERHANGSDYQLALRLAFTDWGLPKQLQVDHEGVFYDNKSKSPFPTQFHLWLLALGISLTFSRFNRPTDQGLTERSHQLWHSQCLQGQTFSDWHALYKRLSGRREFLNQSLPCTSLNDLPPLEAFPDANHSGRPYRPELEAELINLDRVYQFLSQGRWFRLVSTAGTFCLGGQVYYLSPKLARRQVDITFNPFSLELECHDETGSFVKSIPIKGITVEKLMGNLAPHLLLPAFQLALPFTLEDQKVSRLFEIVG